MTKKQFTIYRLIIVALMATSIGVAVNFGYSFVPPLAMLLASLIILRMMKYVDEVVADERDYILGGRAARFTFNITVTSLVALGGALMAYSVHKPYYHTFAYLMLYTACFMMVVNIFTFLYYQKKGDGK